MKSVVFFLSLLFALTTQAQQTIDRTIVSGGVTRDYKLYIPASYNTATPVALVFNFHGLGSTNLQQMFYGDFRPIADTANFIIVHPQGVVSATLNAAYWNAYFGQADDDFTFVKNLIDTISSNYSIDPNRIHSTGMSNGGYMSLALAAEFDDLFASVASVTGTMTLLFPPVPANTKPISVMQIHGTNDATVDYNGNSNSISVQNVLNYWIAHNSTSTTAIVDSVPNTNITDGCYANKYTYGGGTNNTEVVHYKVTNGAHTWPGAPFAIGVTNQDFDASEVIWEFFNKHRKVNTVSVLESQKLENLSFLFHSELNRLEIVKIETTDALNYKVIGMDGKVMNSGLLNNKITHVDTQQFASGIYIVSVTNRIKGKSASFKFVKL